VKWEKTLPYLAAILRPAILRQEEEKPKRTLWMDGSEVFKFAVKIMEHATIKVLEDTGLSMDDIKVIMPHQANIRILEGAAKRLNIPNDKVFSNLHKYGNISSASIPVGLDVDMAPLDKGENVRREICLSLEQMGIQPESSHHEQGPGQHEIDFKYSDALTAADDLMTFKTVVKAVASRTDFLPPLCETILTESGSGLHINISLSKDGFNIFKERNYDSSAAKSFIAGLLIKYWILPHLQIR